jgi:hypothetical protein
MSMPGVAGHVSKNSGLHEMLAKGGVGKPGLVDACQRMVGCMMPAVPLRPQLVGRVGWCVGCRCRQGGGPCRGRRACVGEWWAA